ncbi:resolvase [Chelatococcus daeguensis]|uniref:Resolvase n=1 Tax=Chelatococcus daeguensis TaxID=444444 RepID=A0AAC9NXU7_9HYPH|nr:recombinase family protein [Chelatococcus daeguensis]APF36458.1 resolvase [Chelatococcus daeguensis]
MLLGYARVSKSDGQDVAAQVAALRDAGCGRIFEETASGGRWDRPELQRLLEQLRPNDIVVVWKLDRVSRSLRDLLFIMEKIDRAGAAFRSLTEAIDTTTASGRMTMQMLGSVAEFEREMIRERTRAGLERARREGRRGGRRPKLSERQRREIIHMVRVRGELAADAARLFHVHPSTVARVLAQEPERESGQ